jgi:hypothetical protein
VSSTFPLKPGHERPLRDEEAPAGLERGDLTDADEFVDQRLWLTEKIGSFNRTQDVEAVVGPAGISG